MISTPITGSRFPRARRAVERRAKTTSDGSTHPLHAFGALQAVELDCGHLLVAGLAYPVPIAAAPMPYFWRRRSS